MEHRNEDTHADEGADVQEQPQDDEGNEQEDAVDGLDGVDGDDLSDKDSDLLSEIDEDQFDDYRADPVTIDESITKTLKPAKRKRTDDAPKKPKEGRRAKKRARSEDDDLGGDDYGGGISRRARKARNAGEVRPSKEEQEAARRAAEKEAEANMTPEERRRRALERAMDAAIKNPSKRRRKKDEVDLEDQIDEEIASLKVRMEKACVADNDAREAGKPAVHKLKLLPEVTAMLNRNTVQDAVLDPETNFLQSIKYFLEPLNDGSLPAYNIQRDIFTALTKLPIEKEALLSSGIGKVVLFYTQSNRPEVGIKRMAQRLVGEWSRPILKRTDDYKKRHVETRDFDYAAAKLAQRQAAVSGSQLPVRPASQVSGGSQRYLAEREKALAPVQASNRARPAGLPASYTVAPRSTFDPTRTGQPDHRPIGAGGAEAFRRMTQKGKGGRRG
jgi:transcription factor SPN1